MQVTIGILAAIRSELEPFLALGLSGETTELLSGRPVHIRQATYQIDDQTNIIINLRLMVCGVGKVRAASATQALIDRHQPDLILNVGTAGGIRPEVQVGDLVVTLAQYQHDCQLWERYVSTAHQGLSQLLFDQLRQQYRVHLGNGCAGDIFQADQAAKIKLAERFSAYCVDMESAAIADTCAVNQVPFCVLRSISDSLVGDIDQYEQHHQRVSQSVAAAVTPLFGQLSLQLLASRGRDTRP